MTLKEQIAKNRLAEAYCVLLAAADRRQKRLAAEEGARKTTNSGTDSDAQPEIGGK
ncbi:MAG: hypothetical protein BroJett011_33730 [Chloroflexota bacterium]|nr:MAG: hypothetical protein BroJett011_33730 [Chloroflexota bacterium]